MNAEKGKSVLLDMIGLKCPLPAMKTRRALDRLPEGATLRVLTSDPMSAIDVPHAVTQAGGRIVSQSVDGDRLIFEIVGATRREPKG